jgi:hypothetical protein
MCAWPKGRSRKAFNDQVFNRQEKATGRYRSLKETILYRHFSKDNRLLYVGISISVMARLQQHKSSPWWRDISYITFERFSSCTIAKAAERMAIEKENPLYNIMGKPKAAIAEEIEWSEPWNVEDSAQWQYPPC